MGSDEKCNFLGGGQKCPDARRQQTREEAYLNGTLTKRVRLATTQMGIFHHPLMMNKLLIGGGPLLTPKNIISNGAVYIEDGRIVSVGSFHELKKKYPTVEILDACGGLIMPGLTNTHMHLYSTFARGLNFKGRSPRHFVEILKKLWWRLDKALTAEDVYYSALIPLIECVKFGTTAIIDHHASPNFVRGSLDRIAEALKVIPIRASLCYEVSDRDGKEVAKEGVAENVSFIKRHANEDMLRGMFGLHASFTISKKTLELCVDEESHLDCGFHVHTAEGAADLAKTHEKYKCGVVERWNKCGLLGKKALLAHCVHISSHEIGLIAKSGTNVAHNPQSNMNNAVGSADVSAMLASNVCVGLGTDGMSSDMFAESKSAHLLRKHSEGDPRKGFVETGKLLFKNNYNIFEKIFGWKMGRLSQGCLADIIILDYQVPTELNEDNFLGHFLYAMSSADVKSTVVNGVVLMKDRSLIGIDTAEIYAKARECSEKMWKRMR